MKKISITLFLIALLIISCGGVKKANTFDEGVVINGVHWATRNVDAPGTFTANPEDFGMLFQWNRRQGWNARNENVRGWDNTEAEGTMWYLENDPCPPGWRMPTRDELKSLYYADSKWTTQNGVNGELFGTAPNQLFLPAAGIRDGDSGNLYYQNEAGVYWSTTPYRWDYEEAWTMAFEYTDMGIDIYIGWRAEGFSVRCVSVDTGAPQIESTSSDLEALIEAKLEALGYSEEMLAEMDEEQLSTLLESVLETVLENFMGAFADVFPGMTFETRSDVSTTRSGASTDKSDPVGQWVMINDIRWATRNVDAPGTFAENPENSGMFFRFNRKEGWSSREERVEDWRSVFPEGTTWYAENDPCPPGWRVPTVDELRTLVNAGSEFAVKNGINGRLFGTAPHQIFLPAAGFRVDANRVYAINEVGIYQSSTRDSNEWFSLTMGFDDSSVRAGSMGDIRFSSSVRCVAID